MASTHSFPPTQSKSSAFTSVGWVLLPLRLFLGVTMVYSGLLKLLDSNYLNAASPNSVQAQMQNAAGASPIGGLVSVVAEHANIFGLVIAFGELAVGLGVILGIWTRIAAIGGFLLSLSFFLTVSWGTVPYFFSPDIVFLFAFTPLIIGGDGGLFSIGAVIARNTRRRMHLAVPAPVTESAKVSSEVTRRVLLRTGVVAGAIGTGALVIGTLGHQVFGDSAGVQTANALPPPVPAPSTAPTPPAGGTAITKEANVSVGGVVAFTDPTTNSPAFLLQPAAGVYLAYIGLCTHQGCTVGFDQAKDVFVCPCHGAEFDGMNGDVVRGPARDPLVPISIVSSGGVLYAL